MREAPSLTIIHELLQRGAQIRAFDPVAARRAKSLFDPRAAIATVDESLQAVAGASALLVVTECREFRSPDFAAVRERMRTHVIFDGRNLYDPDLMVQLGFEYFGIGRRVSSFPLRPPSPESEWAPLPARVALAAEAA